jgi:hypothetical protein
LVLVEDDYWQVEEVSECLRDQVTRLELEIIRTESEFRGRFNEWVVVRPDIFVIDVMLRWANPEPYLPAPPLAVAVGGAARGGLRCAQLVLGEERTREVPIVLYTVLDEVDLGGELAGMSGSVRFVRKEVDVGVLAAIVKEMSSGGGGRLIEPE